MSSRRTLILVGALIAGALAALLIVRYVSGIEDRAAGDNEVVSVVVAKGNIADNVDSNGLIQAEVLGLGERRKADLPADAVTRLEDIKGQTSRLAISAGTIITSGMFSSEEDLSDSNSALLEDNMVAMTMSSDQVRAVAGLLRPGDYVNVMYQGFCLKSDPTQIAYETEIEDPEIEVEPCSTLVYQKSRILAIGKSFGETAPAAASGEAVADGSAPTTTEVPASDLITYEIPQEAALLLAHPDVGQVYLTLVRQDYVPIPIDGRTRGEALGSKGFTPYGGDPEAVTDDAAATGAGQ